MAPDARGRRAFDCTSSAAPHGLRRTLRIGTSDDLDLAGNDWSSGRVIAHGLPVGSPSAKGTRLACGLREPADTEAMGIERGA